jgi:hypothetical protein
MGVESLRARGVGYHAIPGAAAFGQSPGIVAVQVHRILHTKDIGRNQSYAGS